MPSRASIRTLAVGSALLSILGLAVGPAAASAARPATQTLSLQNPGHQYAYRGIQVHLQLVATETVPGTRPTFYGPVPPGLSIDYATGLITGTETSCGATASDYQVTVYAADSYSLASASFIWTMAAC